VPRLDAPARAALRRTAKRTPTATTSAPRDGPALTRAALRCPRDLAGLRDCALLHSWPQRARLSAAVVVPAMQRQGRPLLALTREQIRFVEAGLPLPE